MIPYYDEGGITIYHGDARQVLPTLPRSSVDLILTDPPYGVSWKSNMSTTFGPIAGDDGTVPMAEWVRPAIPALKHKRHLYVFGLTDWGDLPVGGRCDLIWDKEMMGLGDCSLPWGPSHERIAFGVYIPSASHRANGRGNLSARLRKGSVLRAPRAHGVGVARHPTEKPVAILREMIESSSRIGETVLDPYMGSGSTLVAARIEGRLAIGIELELKYVEVAIKRLQQSAMALAATA